MGVGGMWRYHVLHGYFSHNDFPNASGVRV